MGLVVANSYSHQLVSSVIEQGPGVTEKYMYSKALHFEKKYIGSDKICHIKVMKVN